MFSQNTYSEDVQAFNKVSAAEAKRLLAAEDLAVVYIGRASCPYCQKFVKKLSKLSTEISTTIYYVDSSNASDPDIETFRETFNVVTVPGFIVGKSGTTTTRCDSSMPEIEILNMVR